MVRVFLKIHVSSLARNLLLFSYFSLFLLKIFSFGVFKRFMI